MASIKTLADIPYGEIIKFGKYQVETEEPEEIEWRIALKDTSNNRVTLITDKIIDLLAFDAYETGNTNSYRQKYGNGRWSVSNIRTFLNSAGAHGNWYRSGHYADYSPTDERVNPRNGYVDKCGFLYWFTPEERGLLLSSQVKTCTNKITDGGDSEYSTEKVFLPSRYEIGLDTENNRYEGTRFDLSISGSAEARKCKVTEQCFNNTKNGYGDKPNSVNNYWPFLLRTPYVDYTSVVRNCNSGGNLYTIDAYNGSYGIRPCIVLPLNTSFYKWKDGFYSRTEEKTLIKRILYKKR